MKINLEAPIQSRCINYLDTFHRVIRVSASTKAGEPDAVACINGKYVEIEFKKPSGGRHSELQKQKKRKCLKAGGIYLLINNFEDFIKNIEKIKKSSCI